jgi:hypothetical protein
MISICYLDVNWLIPKISACRARIWSLVANERSERVTKCHKYLSTMFWGSVFWMFWIMWFFPRKYKYRCIRVYVWFKDNKHVIWMWIWLILKNISLLDRIWSLWLVRFAHSPPNFIVFFYYKHQSHPFSLKVLFTNAVPFLENMNVTTFLMT